MPIEEFLRRAHVAKEKAAVFINNTPEVFPRLMTVTRDQRRTAPRLRDGEHGLLNKVRDIVDKNPALLESLADENEGMNPSKFKDK